MAIIDNYLLLAREVFPDATSAYRAVLGLLGYVES